MNNLLNWLTSSINMLGYKANIHWLPYHYGSSRLTMKCDYAICINIEVQLFHKADHNQTTAMIKKPVEYQFKYMVYKLIRFALTEHYLMQIAWCRSLKEAWPWVPRLQTFKSLFPFIKARLRPIFWGQYPTGMKLMNVDSLEFSFKLVSPPSPESTQHLKCVVWTLNPINRTSFLPNFLSNSFWKEVSRSLSL